MNGDEQIDRVLIAETENELPESDVPADDTLIVRETIQDCTQEEFDRTYAVLSNAELDRELDLEVPAYGMSWPHVIGKRDDQGQLLELTIFGSHLQEYVTEHSPTQLRCTPDLSPGFRAVVGDIARAEGIRAARTATEPATTTRVRRALVTTILIVPFLVDQLASLFFTLFWNPPRKTDVVFVPSLARLDSMFPVIEEATFDFEVVITSNVSSWVSTVRCSRLESYDPVPLSAYTSVSCLLKQLAHYARVSKRTVATDELADAYADTIQEELDVPLQHAPAHAVVRSFRTRMFVSIMSYHLYSRMVDRTGCRRVVTGGLDPGGRALVFAGIAQTVETYHIPHGVGAGGTCPNPPSELKQLVSGNLEKRYYSDSPQVERLWTCIVTGRPYLTRLQDIYATKPPNPPTIDPCHIVLATQPIPPRKEFVENAVSAIKRADFEAEVTIKIHPSESASDYSEYNRDSSVTVAESDLHEYLYDADLTLTINSNVGIEAVVVGTPCVCLNWWDPIISDPMYTRYGGLPLVDDPSELGQLFDELDVEMLRELLEKETNYLHESYRLQTDAARNMAAELDPGNE